MNDTISRKQAIETLIAKANAEGAYGYLDAKSIEDCLANMPPAEPERKTVKWIKHRWAEEAEGILIDNYECSICHTWERKYSNFCPDCGAKMEGLKTNE